MQVEYQRTLAHPVVRAPARAGKLLCAAFFLAFLAGSTGGDALAQNVPCRIIGFAHAFDVANIRVCNYLGQCSHLPQQIPCQHPIWNCR